MANENPKKEVLEPDVNMTLGDQTSKEIEITPNLLEYFQILIEFDERDKSRKAESKSDSGA
jgi:hypothetical protein